MFFGSLFFLNSSYAQEDTLTKGNGNITDTLKQKKHSPKLATILSATIPGAGQVYNKKYFYVPIIYGGAGTLIYLYSNNNKEYNKFLTASRLFQSNDTLEYTPVNINGDLIELNEDVVLQYKEKYRKARDMCVIGIGFIYILNVINASVDAHFFNYDVSDDLSLRIEPVILNHQHANNTYGFKLNVYF